MYLATSGTFTKKLNAFIKLFIWYVNFFFMNRLPAVNIKPHKHIRLDLNIHYTVYTIKLKSLYIL
jgi:hypothetical protein